MHLDFIPVLGSPRCKNKERKKKKKLEHDIYIEGERESKLFVNIPQLGTSCSLSILRSSAATRPMRRSDRKEPILICIVELDGVEGRLFVCVYMYIYTKYDFVVSYVVVGCT